MIPTSWLRQSIITVLCVLGIPSYLSAPRPISVHLEGQSSISVPANRAVITLYIHTEGPQQDQVAEDVRRTAEELLGALRPLAELPSQSQSQSQSSSQPSSAENNCSFTPHDAHLAPCAADDDDGAPPIVTLSVTTFRSSPWQKPQPSPIDGVDRDEPPPVYASSTTIEAEFRSFDALGVLLGRVSRTPLASVRSLKWTLDGATARALAARSRELAMADALDKVRAYVRPLGMDKVRAVRVSEKESQQRRGVHACVMADLGNLAALPRSPRGGVPQAGSSDLNNSADGEGTGGLQQQQQTDASRLEPLKLEIAAEIEGEFCAWKTGLEAWFRRGGV